MGYSGAGRLVREANEVTEVMMSHEYGAVFALAILFPESRFL
jgi:hypothetical protein